MYENIFTDRMRSAIAFSTAVLIMSGCSSGGGSNNVSDPDPDPPPPPPPGNSAPQIAGLPASEVNIDETYSFAPTASDADGDDLTFSIENQPVWASFDSGTGELTGQPTLEHVGVYDAILISVSDGQASASLPSFAVSVNQTGTFSTTLSWTAPTQNEDGSPLTDLAGYKIYWGTTPGVYPNSVTIDNPGLTTHVVGNLAAGTYEFVATAINSDGVESVYSNTATKMLP